MQDLNEASRFMYDFVLQMSHMVQDDKTVIMDDPWWTYLRMNKDVLNKMFTDRETKIVVESYLLYVRKVKNVIVPALSKRRIRKNTSHKIIKRLKNLKNSS